MKLQYNSFWTRYLIRDWIFRFKNFIKDIGRKKNDNYKSFETLNKILGAYNDFFKKHKRPADVIVLRNKAASLYRTYKKATLENKSYYERIFGIDPKLVGLPDSIVVAVHEPTVGKSDITVIKFGSNLRYYQDGVNQNGMETVTIELVDKCTDDVIMERNL